MRYEEYLDEFSDADDNYYPCCKKTGPPPFDLMEIDKTDMGNFGDYPAPIECPFCGEDLDTYEEEDDYEDQ